MSRTPSSGNTSGTQAAKKSAGKQHFIAVNKKTYPRSVKGVFARWRWIFFWGIQSVFYGLCWLPWNGRQAFLCDLAERKFYAFNLIFWPQDVIYLALLLIISAYALFLFTAIGGRLFCGYACPQTLFTSLFLWIEEKIEGNHMARVKLDQAPMSSRKFILKFAKHSAWLIVAVWTGFTFVGYFTPIRTLVAQFSDFSFSSWELAWILLYGGLVYLDAGFLREQICLFMCPYARFQSVMFDPDTLVVTYDVERGEPRGARAKNDDYKVQGKGDCVDCDICVQVCPTGIDIRNGLQSECIGCSACIDACDQVMDKMNYPRGLIRYSTERALAKHWGRKEIIRHLIRPRTIIYGVILALLVTATAYGIATRLPLKVDVIRDRGVMSRELDNGMIENLYRLQIMNVSEVAHRYSISVSGLEGADFDAERIVEIPAAASRIVTLAVRAPAESGKKGSNRIYFDVAEISDPKIAVHEKASFLVP